MRLWAGQTTSLFGSLVGGAALQFTAILYLHARPAQFSLLMICQIAPGFLIGLVAGAWVDRLRRRPVLMLADTGRALALASVPLAAWTGALSLAQLCAVAALTSALGVCFDAAYSAYLPTLVGRDELVEANSKLTASASAAEFGAFSIGGWLVQWLGAPATVLIDAASFLVSAGSLARIRAREAPPEPRAPDASLRREMSEGVRYVLGEPRLRALAVTNGLLQFSSGIVGAVILLYLTRDVGFEPGALGLIFGVGGLTSLVGATCAGRWDWFGGLGRSLVLSLIVRGGGGICLVLATSVSLLGVALLVGSQLITDPAWAFFGVNELSLRQAITPDRLQGRMSAGLRVIDFGAMLLGTVAAGVLGQTLGLRPTLWCATLITVIAAVWLACSPITRLHAMPHQVEATPAPSSVHGE